MKLATAIKILEKDADFLGMRFVDFIKFVKINPLAQPVKTVEAYRVFVNESTKVFG